MIKKIQIVTAVCCAVLLGGMTLAQEPVVNIDPDRHPHLAEAQRLMVKANAEIAEAQKDNRYDMHGRASRARQLLAQASEELKAAAEEANRGGR